MMTNGLKLALLMFELLTIGSAMIVAFHPNILYASISLLFTFIGVAVMFLYAGADFLAGAQVIVYVGGVTILILFAIMLTQWMYALRFRDVRGKLIVPVVFGFLILLPLLYKSVKTLSHWIEAKPPEKMAEFALAPKTAVIGQALLNQYLLPFEAVTILLLGAMVGAVWLARPK